MVFQDTLICTDKGMSRRSKPGIIEDYALTLLDSITEPFYAVDSQWRVTYLTPCTETLWGIAREAALGKVLWDLFPHVDFPSTEGYQIYQRAFKERISLEEEFFSIALQQWIHVSLYPTPEGGLIIHHHDISQKHAARLEQERLLSLVHQLSEERGRIMAVAGHDLRQPLNIISFCLYTLSPLITTERDKKIHEQATIAFNSMMLDLDMLALASQLDQDIVPALKVIDMDSFLREQSTIWMFHAQAKGLTLTIVASGLTVISDSGMLKTILHNLVGNAIKYTAKGSILIGCRRRGSFVSIEVMDSGLGIPEKLQHQIFQAFTQLDGSREGLGLGLSIVRRTAERLGHRIEVKSQAGKGSRFSIVVPRCGK
jgi:signal transduction histidine kinase